MSCCYCRLSWSKSGFQSTIKNSKHTICSHHGNDRQAKCLSCPIFRIQGTVINTFPPEISFFGAKLNHEQKCFSSGNFDMSVPISEAIVWASETLMPSIAARSTPQMRFKCERSSCSDFGAFLERCLDENRRSVIRSGLSLDCKPDRMTL